jgi:uncharacterized protein YraI
MKHLRLLICVALAAVALPSATQAQQVAFAAKAVNLRAGPSRVYPVVAVLSQGYPLTVVGCLSNYRWCDVMAGRYRGWVYARNINYPYQSGYVPVLSYGAKLGVGLIGFVVGNYWAEHYRDRPWYRDRDKWMHRQPAPSPAYRPQPPRPGSVRPGGGERRPSRIVPGPTRPPQRQGTPAGGRQRQEHQNHGPVQQGGHSRQGEKRGNR